MSDKSADLVLTPREDWKDGDFCLISADNVCFKVSSRTLLWAR